ncbi:hypothetical protein LTR62_007507 [Meristemomyces frigidus]|uniref:MJ1316 RNA cyclic group end recognition domain-containing protein n=1 Tax=Meristemomyces frigidus TaxID=1508187 RepID=A0AAN7YDM2_9PEZI|nr:hypothetical protein LTR62_007507 [Meristemomyces frigidus]
MAHADSLDDVPDLFEAMAGAVRVLAKALDAFYVELPHCQRKDDSVLHRPRRYIFPTGTFATILWEQGDDVGLVCLHDSPSMFLMESIGELHIKHHLRPVSRGFDIWLPWKILGMAPSDVVRLKGTRLYLGECCFPESFHLDMITPHPGVVPFMPPFKPHAPKYIQQYHKVIAEAIDYLYITNQEKGLDCFNSVIFHGYYEIYRWAKAMGLVARDLAAMDSRAVLSLVLGAYRGWDREHHEGDFKGSFLRAFFLVADKVVPALEDGPGLLPYRKRAALQSLEYAKTHYFKANGIINTTKLDIDEAEGRRIFLDMSPHYLLLSAECWDHRKRRAFFEDELPATLDMILAEWEACEPRLWPHPSKNAQCWTYIATINQHVPEEKLAHIQEITSLLTPAKSAMVCFMMVTRVQAENLLCPPAPATSNIVSLPPKSTPTSDNDEDGVYDSQASDDPAEKKRRRDKNKNKNANRKQNRKFRSASSAIARVRHDPSLIGTAFEVGYEDRHAGMMFMPLDEWGGGLRRRRTLFRCIG